MSTRQLTLTVLPLDLAVCQLPRKSTIPSWAINNVFFSVTKTQEEISIVCPSAPVPNDIKADKHWRAIRVEGPLSFTMAGLLASISQPLADALIPVFTISTYDTDYILVQDEHLDQSLNVLEPYFVIKS